MDEIDLLRNIVSRLDNAQLAPGVTVLVHGLLANYVLELDHYASTPGVSDRLDDFLTWVENRREVPVTATSGAPAQS